MMDGKVHKISVRKIDFVWSSQKGFASLVPLYEFMQNDGWEVAIHKIYRNRFRNRKTIKSIGNIVILAYDQPLIRLKKLGWSGDFIYIEHGLSPMKYYTYKYEFFHRAVLLFFPGEVFQRKMEAINPNFKNGLLGGYPKMDDLVSTKIDREKMCEKYGLNPNKPVILFAPSWGGKRNKNAGIHNAKHLKNIENLLIVPHSADYRLAKKYGAIVPKDGNINQFLQLADVVVSDVSSVLAEASILNKPVVQMILPSFPGCFPEKDRRKNGIFLSDEQIKLEEQNADLENRPFKIPYLDEDWVMGFTAKPNELKNAIAMAIKNPKKHSENRKYWAEQSAWKFDGNVCGRMTKMIEHFLATGERKQVA